MLLRGIKCYSPEVLDVIEVYMVQSGSFGYLVALRDVGCR